MNETSVGATIVRHIDELEAAMRYTRETMQPRLDKAVSEILEKKRKAFGWNGKIDNDLDREMWLAPPQWRTPGDEAQNYDLFFELDDMLCVDKKETFTWVGAFCAFAGAGICFGFHSNSLGARDWKAVLRSEQVLVGALSAKGFDIDLKSGEFAVRIRIDRDALAEAFAEEEFGEALAPIASALDLVYAERKLLDRLVKAIRKKAG